MLYQMHKLCYRQIYEIVNESNSHDYRLKRIIEFSLFIMWILRIIMALFSFLIDYNNYWLYDPHSQFIYNLNEKLYVYYSTKALLTLFVIMVALYIVFIHRTDSIVYKIFDDFIVINSQQIQQCYHPMAIIENKLQLATFELKNLSHLTVRTRSMIALTLTGMDHFNYVAHILTFIFLLPILYFYYFNTIIHLDHWYQKLISWIDLPTVIFMFFITERLFLIGITFIAINAISSKIQLEPIERFLFKMANEKHYMIIRKCQLNHAVDWRLAKILKLHTLHCRNNMIIFRKFWGRLVLLWIAFGIPLTASILFILIIKNPTWIEQFCFTAILIVHSAVIIQAHLILARQTNQLHRPKYHLTRIIPNITCIKLKIRYDDWHHRLVCGNQQKYGSTIPIIGTITRQLVFEMITIYVGFLLFLFQYLRDIYQ
ncbi:hypothetical protein HUG17_9184 [Dermatophagoides farinae]|uniref:Uncharacterized protein n=1 Tax=Dermatophagoides farinae TaxID=6954 RepID=A0A9D4SDH5_DERFA|nr:hypothetical protein HUG17_9184 [Dermatophagoides farinae]